MHCVRLTDEVFGSILNARDKDFLAKIADEWCCGAAHALTTITTRALSDMAVKLADEKSERVGGYGAD